MRRSQFVHNDCCDSSFVHKHGLFVALGINIANLSYYDKRMQTRAITFHPR